MSKPKPLEFTLSDWCIKYRKSGASTGGFGPATERKYGASVDWMLWLPDIDNPTHSVHHGKREEKWFATYDEAKVWIDEQIGPDHAK